MGRVAFFFGLPGAGKTFCANIYAREFDAHFHDGDLDLPTRMRSALAAGSVVSDDMRQEFFDELFKNVHSLHSLHPRIVVAQTFLEDEYRLIARKEFIDARFVLVEALDETRNARLAARASDLALSESYLEAMSSRFQPPSFPCHSIDNSEDGEGYVVAQLKRLFR